MNDIKQLEERIAQLTELVKTGSEAIKNMETALKAAEEERDRLADQRRESEPKFERNVGGMYYYICDNGAMEVDSSCDVNDVVACNQSICNNYFKTERRAQEVADKINFLLKLERLHDTFCPDYKPNWNDGENKYFVFYDNNSKRYAFNAVAIVEYEPIVYFPSSEIAQKVCNILNAELEGKI